MLKHLIVKTSSLGDIVHMLPAISDAKRKIPDISFDWVAESGFIEIPAWHPDIDQVIEIGLRKWRKQLFSKATRNAYKKFKTQLKATHYGKAIDSQGLIKSALVARMSQGETWGYDKHSIREPFASYLYKNKVSVSYQEHAVTRNRLILAKSLGYTIDDLSLDYGIAGNPVFEQAFNELAKHEVFQGNGIPEKNIIALHGTSRKNKEWPIPHWNQFIQKMGGMGYSVIFPWGNEEELARAQSFADNHHNAIVLPRCSLTTLSGLIQNASAVIGMDTGLLHIAAAFDKKGVALYPATEPKKSGAMSASGLIESIGGKASLDLDSINAKMLALLKPVEKVG